MNQVRILKSEEEKNEDEIEIILDSECKIAFDVDIEYIVTLAMEHLAYKFDKNARVNKKSFKSSKVFFTRHQNKISDIIGKEIISTIESIAIILNKSNDSIQSLLEGLNALNLEAYILSIISEVITDEMFSLLTHKKDELK